MFRRLRQGVSQMTSRIPTFFPETYDSFLTTYFIIYTAFSDSPSTLPPVTCTVNLRGFAGFS